MIYLVFVHAVTFLFTWLFNHTTGSLLPVPLLLGITATVHLRRTPLVPDQPHTT